MRRLALILFWIAVASPAAFSPAGAQVGFPPEASPFRDIPFRQGLSGFAGIVNGNRGTAGVGLQSGFILGARHDLRLSGPLSLTSRLALVSSDRQVLDPSQPADQQDAGMRNATLAIADLGFTFSITGARTWRRISPVLHAGVGISSDLGAESDPGGFSLGTSFALAFGGGVRWLPGDNLAFRMDFTDYLLRYSYPQFFFTPPVGGAPILPPGGPQNEWRHNPALTFGVTYQFAR